MTLARARVPGLPAPLAAAAALLLLPATLPAQLPADDWCRDVDRDRYCEVRHLAAPARAGDFVIDVGPNGSIEVEGYSGTEVRVAARVVGRGRNESAARDLARSVEVLLAPGDLRASGPRTWWLAGWTVSVRVQVPMGTSIDARTTNGPITVQGTGGSVQARTTNGSIRLSDVTGRIQARSTNGPIRAALRNDAAPLEGVELRTTNGSVQLALPARTSANVALSTTNGGIHSELPIAAQGRITNRQLTGTLGNGGPEIRVSTTNGGIRLTSQ